ncbi:MAG: hypothetical protein PF495_15910 [Spirochaetales bacterium]|jgi:hypothetical protein|nr:hypothetical protein [Spirochaetales bacterium]
MTYLKALSEEIEHRKQEAFLLLRHEYEEEEITSLCNTFANCQEFEQLQTDYASGTFFAVLALIKYMRLEVLLTRVNLKTKLTSEQFADFTLDAMNASLCLVEAGWKPSELFANKGKLFTGSPTKKKTDKLGQIIQKTFTEFQNNNNRHPTAIELWNLIPEGENIQEIDQLDGTTTYDNSTKNIWWKADSGKYKETTFHSFQARLTEIKKLS